MMATRAAPAQHNVGLEFIAVNGVRIAYADRGGATTPLVLIHGSWGSHHNWDAVAPALAGSFRVVSYDRRGHSDSERPPGQGYVSEHVADLAALIQGLGLAPAWVVGNSAGAVISLKLAAARPDLLRGIVVHEPPLFGLLDQGGVAAVPTGPLTEVGRRIAAGDHAGAAELFVEEVALGPGSWAQMPEQMRAMMAGNAPTFLDELNDPEWDIVDDTRLARYDGPVLITSGDQSPPIFQPVVSRLAGLLPQARHTTYAGAGHIPQVTHPEEYVAEVVAFIRSVEVSQR
jgi:pimeloyl-ACP methyl ester carboxylesterase